MAECDLPHFDGLRRIRLVGSIGNGEIDTTLTTEYAVFYWFHASKTALEATQISTSSKGTAGPLCGYPKPLRFGRIMVNFPSITTERKDIIHRVLLGIRSFVSQETLFVQ